MFQFNPILAESEPADLVFLNGPVASKFDDLDNIENDDVTEIDNDDVSEIDDVFQSDDDDRDKDEQDQVMLGVERGKACAWMHVSLYQRLWSVQ